MTRSRLHAQVIDSLGGLHDAFDPDAICEAICESYDVRAMDRVDEIEASAYWAIVARHARTEVPGEI